MIHIMYYSQKITNCLYLFSIAQSPMSSFYLFFLTVQKITSAPLVADHSQLIYFSMKQSPPQDFLSPILFFKITTNNIAYTLSLACRSQIV